MLNAKDDEEKFKASLERLKAGSVKHFKDLDVDLDREILAALIKINVEDLEPGQYPAIYKTMYDKSNGDVNSILKKIYSKSYIVSEEKMNKLWTYSPKKIVKILSKDPFFKMFKAGADHFYKNIAPQYANIQDEIDRLMRDYMAAQMEVFSGKRFFIQMQIVQCD